MWRGRHNPGMTDLTDAEFAELDELLAQAPYDLQVLDAVALDGYLCGVLVQPRLIAESEWLPAVFGDGLDAATVAARADPAWLARCSELIVRRHAALNRAIAEDGGFDPLILEEDPDASEHEPQADADAPPRDLEAADASRQAPDAAEDADSADDDEIAASMAAVDPLSRPLLPWVAGFDYAQQLFPDLEDLPDEPIMATLARLYRHLPPDTDETRDVVATMQAEYPLHDLDDAVGDLVAAVVELWDLTQPQRYRVDTVRREAPKVGRNDPCPCGSGRKYKQCHGANA